MVEEVKPSPDGQKKPGRPATRVVPQQGVGLSAEILTALDRWRVGRDDLAVGRSAAMRRIIIDRLKADGYLPAAGIEVG